MKDIVEVVAEAPEPQIQEQTVEVFKSSQQVRVSESVVWQIVPVPRTQEHVVEVLKVTPAGAGVGTQGRRDRRGGAHPSCGAVEVWSTVKVRS